MDRVRVVAMVERVVAFDATCVDRDEIAAVANDIARLRSWLAARDATVATALGRVASFPEKTLADATRVPLRDAQRLIERADLLRNAPPLADALDDGRIDAGHVDAFGRGLRSLDEPHRQALLDDAPRLALVAETVDADRFAQRVRDEVERIRAEDGIARLERQRRDTRLTTWVDKTTGMWRLSGAFDPETGLALHAGLQAMKERLFHQDQPATCPDDPMERDRHLTAHALATLITGRHTPAVHRAEIVPVVDLTAPATPDGPTVDWGLPVELPVAVLEQLLPQALISPVVLASGAVIHAPGQLELGRTTRLANRAQRRALRALYRECAIPGCTTPFDHCRIHHVIWWRHGGPTNLDNLLPLCTHHHTRIHNELWELHLAPDRTLRIRLPDGQRLTGQANRQHAPPRAA